MTQHMARGPGGGCTSYPGSPEWAAVTKVALEEGARAAPSAPEAGLEPPGADHTVSWGGGRWARCLCSLALVAERLLNTHEPEWVWGWPGWWVEDRRTLGTQAKGACEVVTASRHVLKLGLPGWAGFPLAIAQASLRAFSLLLQTFSQHVGVGAGMTRDPQGSGEAGGPGRQIGPLGGGLGLSLGKGPRSGPATTGADLRPLSPRPAASSHTRAS